ncbi:MAG: MotA/TolQ/ExbB proton channel family protein [Planctomycetes bacterium]|nr:MotA/TolQ/ExbB proton channel family protein [Planctomycetota bacterium]
MALFAGKTRGRWIGVFFSLFLLSTVMGTMAVTPAIAVAQEDNQGDTKNALSSNIIVHFFESIGWVFGIIFAVISIGAVALIIVLVMDLRMSEAVPTTFIDEFTDMVNKRQFKQAFELCRSDNSFLARVLTAGMARLQYGIDDAREAMFNMVDTVRASKDNLITYLATIGTLGPLLGLVGTVSGMIGAFYTLGSSKDAPNASRLAGDISHALVVTLVGVALAVPAIFFFSFFKNRLTNIAMNASNLADDLLTQMYHNSKRAAAPTPTAADTRTSGAVQATPG